MQPQHAYCVGVVCIRLWVSKDVFSLHAMPHAADLSTLQAPRPLPRLVKTQKGLVHDRRPFQPLIALEPENHVPDVGFRLFLLRLLPLLLLRRLQLVVVVVVRLLLLRLLRLLRLWRQTHRRSALCRAASSRSGRWSTSGRDARQSEQTRRRGV